MTASILQRGKLRQILHTVKTTSHPGTQALVWAPDSSRACLPGTVPCVWERLPCLGPASLAATFICGHLYSGLEAGGGAGVLNARAGWARVLCLQTTSPPQVFRSKMLGQGPGPGGKLVPAMRGSLTVLVPPKLACLLELFLRMPAKMQTHCTGP